MYTYCALFAYLVVAFQPPHYPWVRFGIRDNLYLCSCAKCEFLILIASSALNNEKLHSGNGAEISMWKEKTKYAKRKRLRYPESPQHSIFLLTLRLKRD